MRRAWKTAAAVSVALLLVWGCSQVPPTHFYVLEMQESAAVRAQSEEGWAIGVRSFVVDAPYDQDRIVYRLGEGFQGSVQGPVELVDAEHREGHAQ